MIKTVTVTLLSLMLISGGAKAQTTDKDKKRIDNVCDSFMKLFLENKIHDGLALLKQNTVITPESIDQLEGTIDGQVKEKFIAFGKMTSYEFVAEKKIKDFIAKRYYILKFDKFYLKFQFVEYKSPTGWTITGFNYNEDISELLNE